MENVKSDVDVNDIYERLIMNGDTYTAKVTGRSMYPYLKNGDTIKIQKISDYKKNDVILIRRKDRFIIHRLIDITTINGKLFYLSKGDNNNFIDRWYSSNLVIGKVIEIIQD